MSTEIERSEAGNPILRHEARETGWEAPTYDHEEHSERMAIHIEKYVGKIETVFHEIISDLVHIDVNFIKPTEEYPFYTFITEGMSNKAMTPMAGAEEYKYAELVISLPASWKVTEEDFKDESNYWPIRWLKTLARLPHAYKSWLNIAHTIPNGDPQRPLAPNTKLSGFILMPPVIFDDAFASLEINKDLKINYLYVCPLYKEEMDYKLKYGAEKLFDKFDEEQVDLVVDIKRKNLCKKNRFKK